MVTGTTKSNQASIRWPVLPHHDRALTYVIALVQRRFNLAGFDSEATQLHLMVDAPKEL